ncbi:hypothetical protein [Candidatus Regiella endosymbiont of Tuberolachnus salignus]|uniref:hypothetical protein n=1 Tax=Candidatus Regiella endosymbiont of Tuberolachnus salignus TaxID=3077956 RepID=UPI0030D0F32A
MNEKLDLFRYIPFAFEVAFGCQGVRPMSVDRLRDSASTRSQQRGGFKGEGYIYCKRYLKHNIKD